MNSGWIKLHRKIMENPSYHTEPFCRNMAWIDLLLLANHETGYFRVRGIKVTVKRGQVGFGIEKLGQRWGWSRGKVERYLTELEQDGQIVRQKNNVTTLLSIVSYEDYQGDSKADYTADSKANSKANSKADGQQTVKQTDINKNEKNEENEKNVKNEKNIIQPASPTAAKSAYKKVKHLFDQSPYANLETLQMYFLGKAPYDTADIAYYQQAARTWSMSNGEKKLDWALTIQNWMHRDYQEGKLKTIKTKLNGNAQRTTATELTTANDEKPVFRGL